MSITYCARLYDRNYKVENIMVIVGDRKTTGDILTDAYKQSTNAQKEGLDNISEALRDIAKAIHRFCDIAESQKEN
jgi:hypothetical protein